MGKLIIISAPSGTGKSSLVGELCTSDSQLVVSISHTTRPQGPGEQDGVHYFFVDTPTFQTMIKEGKFLEHATIYDYDYGTSKAWVEAQLNDDQDVILEIDWQGAEQVRKLIPDSSYIFILPPSIRALEMRLQARGRENEVMIQRRMCTVKNELSHCHQADYIVVNDNFPYALSELRRVISTIRKNQPIQQKDTSQLISDLLAES